MKVIIIYCLFFLFFLLGNIQKKVKLGILTGEFYYEKTPNGDMLIVEYRKRKTKKWKIASIKEEKLLKTLKYIK